MERVFDGPGTRVAIDDSVSRQDPPPGVRVKDAGTFAAR